MSNIAFGDTGEKLAADYLRSAGYKITALKYRAKPGEIDVIAEKSGTLCFVEVKTRSSYVFGTPAEAVTYRKQQKIINTAMCFLKQTGNLDMPIRFDVMEVILPTGGRAQCNHIINAFGR
jgi:putative endonuclease